MPAIKAHLTNHWSPAQLQQLAQLLGADWQTIAVHVSGLVEVGQTADRLVGWAHMQSKLPSLAEEMGYQAPTGDWRADLAKQVLNPGQRPGSK